MSRDAIAIALLALLAEEPATAEAVRSAFITRRHDRLVDWNDATLTEAIAAQQGEGRIRDEGGVLSVTPTGHEHLVAWTREFLAGGREHVERPRFDLALLTAHSVPMEVAREALAARLRELDEQTSQLTTRIRTSARRGLSAEYAMQADYRRALLVAEFRWLATLLERMDSGELAWTVGGAPASPPETV